MNTNNVFFKMTIVTQDTFCVLGNNGIESFFAIFSEDSDSVFDIDDDFLEKIKQMEVYEFGFTQEFKDKMIDLFELRKCQKAFITSNWLIGYYSVRAQGYMKFVQELNKGKSFEEAKEIVFTNLNQTNY